MSVRNDILDNLVTALQAVTGSPYVARGEVPDPGNRTQYPALYVQEDGGDQTDRYCYGYKAQKTMLISIPGFYRDNPDNLAANFNTFLEAVEDAIDGASLGTYCRDCRVLSVLPIITDDGDHTVRFQVNVQIKYWRTLA